MRLLARVFLSVLAVATPRLAPASVVSIGAAADNTLYEDVTGTLSNGAGEHLFAGRTNLNSLRRGLIRFDIAAAVPAGSTIQSVSLRLNMSRGSSSLAQVSLHRAQRAWGEGTSDAPDEEGTGAGAAPGDATWLNTFFPNQLWVNPGGDFDTTSSASALVSVTGPYLWSSAGAAADAQAWLDSPATNFGWFILADETQFPTAKRFDTRENAAPANRPSLTITYTVPGPGTISLVFLALPLSRRRRA